jgi:hypothetical protein
MGRKMPFMDAHKIRGAKKLEAAITQTVLTDRD